MNASVGPSAMRRLSCWATLFFSKWIWVPAQFIATSRPPPYLCSSISPRYEETATAAELSGVPSGTSCRSVYIASCTSGTRTSRRLASIPVTASRGGVRISTSDSMHSGTVFSWTAVRSCICFASKLFTWTASESCLPCKTPALPPLLNRPVQGANVPRLRLSEYVTKRAVSYTRVLQRDTVRFG